MSNWFLLGQEVLRAAFVSEIYHFSLFHRFYCYFLFWSVGTNYNLLLCCQWQEPNTFGDWTEIKIATAIIHTKMRLMICQHVKASPRFLKWSGIYQGFCSKWKSCIRRKINPIYILTSISSISIVLFEWNVNFEWVESAMIKAAKYMI